MQTALELPLSIIFVFHSTFGDCSWTDFCALGKPKYAKTGRKKKKKKLFYFHGNINSHSAGKTAASQSTHSTTAPEGSLYCNIWPKITWHATVFPQTQRESEIKLTGKQTVNSFSVFMLGGRKQSLNIWEGKDGMFMVGTLFSWPKM